MRHKKNGKLVGAQAKIEKIVNESVPNRTLVTNIFSEPTPKAADLMAEKKVSEVFEFLMFSIRHRVAYVHRNKPIQFFKERVDCPRFSEIEKSPQEAVWKELRFQLFATSGPLLKLSFEKAKQVGRVLHTAFQAKRDNHE